MRPHTPADVDVSTARKVMTLIDRLEESDDIQDVYHNMALTDEIIEQLEG